MITGKPYQPMHSKADWHTTIKTNDGKYICLQFGYQFSEEEVLSILKKFDDAISI